MKKLLRLTPPIIAIILVIVVTIVLVLHFVSLIEEIPEGISDSWYMIQLYKLTNGINSITAFTVGGCGFISFLVSVKWLFESIYAIKDNK